MLTVNEDAKRQLEDLELDWLMATKPMAPLADLHASLMRGETSVTLRLQLYLSTRPQPGVAMSDENAEHLAVLVETAPFLDSTVLHADIADATQYHRLRAAWASALAKFGDDPDAMVRAFHFYFPWDDASAERALQRALEVGDNQSEVHLCAVDFHVHGLERGRAGASAARARFHGERALELAIIDGSEGQVALANYVAGESERAAALASSASVARGSYAEESAHLANTTLGLIALDANDLPKAEFYLMASCPSSGSSRVPSFRLASRLLERGRDDVVTAWLRAMGNVWPRGAKRCSEWVAQVQAGQRPTWTTNLSHHDAYIGDPED